jgi:response regulator of citrate/malate metabolism
VKRDKHGWPRDPSLVRIVVIDDDCEIQLLLRSILAHFHHSHVEVARNAAQLAGLADTRPLDLVFLDISLADGDDGFALLGGLLERPQPPFVVMISSDSTAANVRRAMGAGAGYFVVKPFTSANVKSVLERFHFGTARAPASQSATAMVAAVAGTGGE